MNLTSKGVYISVAGHNYEISMFNFLNNNVLIVLKTKTFRFIYLLSNLYDKLIYVKKFCIFKNFIIR